MKIGKELIAPYHKKHKTIRFLDKHGRKFYFRAIDTIKSVLMRLKNMTSK